MPSLYQVKQRVYGINKKGEKEMVLTFVILLGVLFSALFVVSYIAEKQIFSPWSVTLGVWVIVLCAYLGVHKELYAISFNFVKCLAVWVLTFSFSSYAAYKLTPAYKKPQWVPCEKNIDIITLITVILVPLAVYKAIQHAAMLGDPEGLFLTLREQAIDPEENQLGFVKYFVYIANVLLMIEVCRTKIRKGRLVVISFICFLFFIATMAKQTLFMYLFTSLYLLYDNKKITLRPIAITAVLLILSIPLMYLLRGGEGEETDAEFIGSLLMTYSVASLISFDYIVPSSSFWWGEETFRPFYNVLHALGFNVGTTSLIQDFVYVPMITNVYTVMAPFYKDFGIWGIFTFALFEGILYGVLFKYSKTGNNLVRYLYAYMFSQLVMQFFDEEFFKAFSSIIQIIIVLLFCHIKFKYEWPLKQSILHE